MLNFSTNFSKLFSKISRYDSPVILSLIKIKLPLPDDDKQPQHLTLPSPCLTMGMVHSDSNSSLGERHTMTFPSDKKRLNLLSSDQSTLFQKPKGFSRYIPNVCVDLPYLHKVLYERQVHIDRLMQSTTDRRL